MIGLGVTTTFAGSIQSRAQGLIQEDFPFQTACIGSQLQTNLVTRRRDGKPVLGEDGQEIKVANINSTDKAYKGIAIRLGSDSHICFDTDLLRYSAGWTGKFISQKGVTFDGSHGGHPEIAGTQRFGTKMLPGWADETGDFRDTRPKPYGPIPSNQGRWNGLYVVGDKVVLTYTVLGTSIAEQPSSIKNGDEVAFIRTFDMQKAKSALSLKLADWEGASGQMDGNRAILKKENQILIVQLVDAPKKAALNWQKSGLTLNLPKGSKGKFAVALWQGTEPKKFDAFSFAKPDLVNFKKGGVPHWPEPVITKGTLASSLTPDGAYVLDQVTPPTENPWKRRVRFAGLDFFSDGRAALSTWDGDIWIVSGLDQGLEKITWRRFASGGFETLGLKIVNDVIYTSGRDQVTRYHDINKDGEADFYENFNNQITSSTGFHEFVFDLHTDKAGNFYFAKAGPVRGGGNGFGGGGGNGEITEHAGSLLKLSKDGKKLEVFATGFRAPNGIGVGPNGEVTTGDNEGTWVPACPINWVEQGGFYGVETLAHDISTSKFKQPLCWLSKNDADNSGGGQVWVTSKKWGPLKGELLHMSYGKCAIYHVLKEKVGDQMQGGVVKIPVKFTSSAMRARFHPIDGQLYVAGLQGWQTSAAKITGLDRIRYTGKPVYGVNGMNVTKTGVKLQFSQPLDEASANDVQNWSGKRWNYNRTENYGSPELSVENPKKSGRDDLDITKATLQPDGKTVLLEIADFKPVMQQNLNFDIKAKDGTPIKQSVQHTVNVIP